MRKKKLFNMFKRDDLKILTEMRLYEDHEKNDFCKILSLRNFKKD